MGPPLVQWPERDPLRCSQFAAGGLLIPWGSYCCAFARTGRIRDNCAFPLAEANDPYVVGERTQFLRTQRWHTFRGVPIVLTCRLDDLHRRLCYLTSKESK